MVGDAAAPRPALSGRIAARLFPPTRPLAVERVPEGVSTFVYRIARGDETFYLRVLPEAGASFAPEVGVHQLLRARGVRVPEVIHFAHHDPTLGRSVLVTTEVPGRSLARHGLDERTPGALRAAGRDLAALNGIPVDGFGWIDRAHDQPDRLAAPHRSFRAFAREHLAGDLAILSRVVPDGSLPGAIERTLADRDRWLDAGRGQLAHGDLDATHIYLAGGAYSGIIDLGEIRGTDRWYDLGHAHLHDGERLPVPIAPWLLAGYREVAPLPNDTELRVAFAALLIALRTLGRLLVKRPDSPLVGHSLAALRRDAATLAAAR